MSSTHADPTTTLADPTSASRKTRLLRAIARAGAGPSGAFAGSRFFPLWAVIRHTGRRTGREYATPIAVQRTRAGFLITLPFGGSTQWARNVLAADGCTIRWRGRDHRTTHPEVVDWDQARAGYGFLLRTVIPFLGVRDFLRLTDVEPGR